MRWPRPAVTLYLCFCEVFLSFSFYHTSRMRTISLTLAQLGTTRLPAQSPSAQYITPSKAWTNPPGTFPQYHVAACYSSLYTARWLPRTEGCVRFRDSCFASIRPPVRVLHPQTTADHPLSRTSVKSENGLRPRNETIPTSDVTAQLGLMGRMMHLFWSFMFRPRGASVERLCRALPFGLAIKILIVQCLLLFCPCLYPPGYST
ncbi:hypothetical protein LX32DRAFT_172358 [Colletotrichum zoysiae]|uniref:Uncharacterized protein n=1 Tax=Colletotrichum zoysiae TaxID=1216348 RepID=A0AAD9LUU1_9PEZI|nr:hypothetical protein LX32DRAFT_172358 [Colletotrichum zoysiae]